MQAPTGKNEPTDSDPRRLKRDNHSRPQNVEAMPPMQGHLAFLIGGTKRTKECYTERSGRPLPEPPDNVLPAGLAPETLRKTSLEGLKSGSKVNLERSLQPSGRMGGHFVQGHVDGTGVIAQFEPDGDSLVVTIKTTPELLRYIVKKVGVRRERM